MANNPSLRVLLAEDSSLLAARLAELIRRLPDVDLIETVDTEAGALGSIAGSRPDVLMFPGSATATAASGGNWSSRASPCR